MRPSVSLAAGCSNLCSAIPLSSALGAHEVFINKMGDMMLLQRLIDRLLTVDSGAQGGIKEC
jgi:hypothetical protein